LVGNSVAHDAIPKKGDTKMFKTITGAMAMALLLNAGAAMAADGVFTTIGSAGTVDEANVSAVVLGAVSAAIPSSKPVNTSATIRYNVLAAEGIDALWDGPMMEVRYKDAGTGERVRASLKGYNIRTGVTSTILTFDSDTQPQSTSSRLGVVFPTGCFSSFRFNFIDNVYFVEATLTKSGPVSLDPKLLGPTLYSISVGRNLC
jgi:hypothetical protein